MPPQMEGSFLSIDILDTRVSNGVPRAILIQDICPTVNKETLKLYFESGCVSGEVRIQAIEYIGILLFTLACKL